MAILLPEATKGPFSGARLQAQGSPASRAPRLPQGGNRGSHWVKAGPCPPLAQVDWAGLGWPSAAVRLFLLLQTGGEQPWTRRRTSCGRSDQEEGQGEEAPRPWHAARRRFSSRRGRQGCVGCAVAGTACPQLGLPAVARARRTWQWCAGPCRPSARPSPTVGGVGASLSPRTSSPTGSTSSWRCSTGEEVKRESGGAHPCPAPALDLMVGGIHHISRGIIAQPHPPDGCGGIWRANNRRGGKYAIYILSFV